MYNLTNSPAGPLGQAGQSNMSTQPQGLFANAPAAFNNFGKGLDNFTSGLHDKLGGLMNKLFPGLSGGDGSGLSGIVPGLASIPGAIGQIPQNVSNGVASIFGGGPGADKPQGVPGVPGAPPTMGAPAPGGPGAAGAPTGGFLSRFMGGGQ